MTDEFQEPLDRIEGTARDLSRLLNQNRSMGNATINVQAGGIGLWMAVTCCIIQMIILIVIIAGGWYVVSRQDEAIKAQDVKLTRAQDYLNAIYQQAPQLKPKANQ